MPGTVVVQASSAAWRFAPVIVAATAAARLRGLRPRAGGRGMLLAGNSVHGFGMDEALLAVFLDAAGTVLAVQTLYPRTVVRHAPAAWTLELPYSAEIPQPGETLQVLAPPR